MSERWPRLGYKIIGGANPGKTYKKPVASLDYVVTIYDRRWLQFAAESTDSELPGPFKWGIAHLLRHLAKKKVLNVIPKAPGGVLGLNRAVHYLVRLELRNGRKKDALAEVAAAWSAAKATIIDAVTDYRDQASDTLEMIAKMYLKRPPRPGQAPATRAQFLEAFDGDLCDQAQRMRKPPRRTRTARKKTR